MSINDKQTFRNAFIQHYKNLNPHVELWNRNSDYSMGKVGSKVSVGTLNDKPNGYTIDLKNGCTHGDDCKPDLVKCPIEHVLIVFNKDDVEIPVFDFQPMSASSADSRTGSSGHGKNILEYRAEYGIFDTNIDNTTKTFKQDKMSKIVVFHPRYHLEDIWWWMNHNMKERQHPLHGDGHLTHSITMRRMMRRYIFLSVDYLEKNKIPKHQAFKVSDYINDREREMMINFYGIPGSDEMTKNMGNPNICSTEEGNASRYWDAETSDRWDQAKINLYTCRHQKVGNNVEKDHVCTTRHQEGGAFDRCRRCKDNCEGEYVSRPCSRNNWYSNFTEEDTYKPNNSIEVNGKVCPFDGYGTEIPDDVNNIDDVCWKSDFLTREWDGLCKNYTHFKKNYCTGSPGDDLKMWKPEDYANARYLSDVTRCKPSIEEMDNLCDWVAANDYSGNISGIPMVAHCGCKKDSFTKNGGNVDLFLSMHGNQQMLDTFKKWSQNDVLNKHLFVHSNGDRGLKDKSDVRGIVETTGPRCWQSCKHALKYEENQQAESYLDPNEKEACVWSGCLNQADLSDSIDSVIQNVQQSCVRQSVNGGGDNNDSISNSPYQSYNNTGNNDDEKDSDNDDEKDSDNDDEKDSDDGSDQDSDDDDEKENFFNLTNTQLGISGGGVFFIITCCCMLAVLMIVLAMSSGSNNTTQF